MKYFKILYPVALEKKLKQEGLSKIHFVDWSLISDHEAQAQRNHGQSLETLNNRGGLAPTEFYAVVNNLLYRDVKMTEYECFIWISEKIKS